jgi:nitroreductase
LLELSKVFFDRMNHRRTVRTFSSEKIPIEAIKNAIRTANTAPSGANKQPWHFVIVESAEIKSQIKIAAEKEEREFYSSRAPKSWLKDLEPFGTNENKPFLELAPYLIVVFEEKYRINENGEKEKNYYTKESVGLATGLLLTALHNLGLATLTHTPSPMKFLSKILKRPINETPFLLIVVGHPEKGTTVPNIKRKDLKEILTIC